MRAGKAVFCILGEDGDRDVASAASIVDRRHVRASVIPGYWFIRAWAAPTEARGEMPRVDPALVSAWPLTISMAGAFPREDLERAGRAVEAPRRKTSANDSFVNNFVR